MVVEQPHPPGVSAVRLLPTLRAGEVVVHLQSPCEKEEGQEDPAPDNVVLQHLRAHLGPVGEGQEHVIVLLSEEEGAVAGHEGEGPEGDQQVGGAGVEGEGEVDHLGGDGQLCPDHLVAQAEEKYSEEPEGEVGENEFDGLPLADVLLGYKGEFLVPRYGREVEGAVLDGGQLLVVADAEGALRVLEVLGEVDLDHEFPLAVAHLGHRVLRGAGEVDFLGEVHLREEEEARVERKGERATILLPISFCIAEGEVDLDSLVDAGGGQERAGAGAAVLILYSTGGGAAVLVNDISVVTEGRVGRE